MKGLQEALRDREERHSRVERHDISEEAQERNSRIFCSLRRGMRVTVEYFRAFHDVEKCGTVSAVDLPFRYLILDEERISFEDIYSIRIV